MLHGYIQYGIGRTTLGGVDMERAACYTCRCIVDITYVPLNDGSGVVTGVLVGVCTICNSICSLPATSTPKVQAALRGK